jgi:spoIIIJ-associated protein
MTTRQGALEMRSIETEGETIDRAIEKALRSLGVERDRVEIEILAAPSRGMFGFGGKPARIRAALRHPVSLESVGSEMPSVSRGTSGPQATAVSETAPAEDRNSVTAADVSIGPLGAKASGLLGGSWTGWRVLPHRGTSGCGSGVIQLDVMGDAGGLLIGRRGQTLDAPEYLVNRIVTRTRMRLPAGSRSTSRATGNDVASICVPWRGASPRRPRRPGLL